MDFPGHYAGIVEGNRIHYEVISTIQRKRSRLSEKIIKMTADRHSDNENFIQQSASSNGELINVKWSSELRVKVEVDSPTEESADNAFDA